MRTDMRSKITIKHRASTQNAYGEEVLWTTLATTWASVEPLLGNEYFSAERVNSKVELKFRCFYFSGPDNHMRIDYNGDSYDILSAVNVKGLNREWLFYAKKVME